MKKITDVEFIGWLYMTNSESGKWIYQSPDNTESAMVEPSNGEVIFIMDVKTQEPIYTSVNAKKYSKGVGRNLV